MIGRDQYIAFLSCCLVMIKDLARYLFVPKISYSIVSMRSDTVCKLEKRMKRGAGLPVSEW